MGLVLVVVKDPGGVELFSAPLVGLAILYLATQWLSPHFASGPVVLTTCALCRAVSVLMLWKRRSTVITTLVALRREHCDPCRRRDPARNFGSASNPARWHLDARRLQRRRIGAHGRRVRPTYRRMPLTRASNGISIHSALASTAQYLSGRHQGTVSGGLMTIFGLKSSNLSSRSRLFALL